MAAPIQTVRFTDISTTRERWVDVTALDFTSTDDGTVASHIKAISGSDDAVTAEVRHTAEANGWEVMIFSYDWSVQPRGVRL